MIQRILTPLDPSAYTAAAMQYSCYIAKREKAEVTGVAVLDIPEIEKAVWPEAAGGFFWAEKLKEHKLEDAQKHIDTLLKKFKTVCSEQGIKHSAAEEQGSPSEKIVMDSMFYDLLVMGQKTFYHFETEPGPGETLHKVLKQTITPILAVPDHFQEIKKVLVAFDGSMPTARALQRFTHLAIASDLEVQVVMSGKVEEEGKYYLKNASTYLHKYGVKKIRTHFTKEPIQEVLQEKYLKWADLVVCGMHSQNLIQKFFVGSLSRFLIEESDKAVFLAQ